MLKDFFPSIIWSLVIFGLCSMPSSAIPEFHWLDMLSFDKWVHAGIFFILILNFRRSLLLSVKWNNKSTSLLFLFIGILYGGLLELMQFYVFSSRSGEWSDFAANAFGCLIGYFSFNQIVLKFPLLIKKN